MQEADRSLPGRGQRATQGAHGAWRREGHLVSLIGAGWRGFCSVCGSTLFWNPTREGYEYTAVAMGAFDSPTGGARVRKHTFVGDKGDYYDIEDGAPQSLGF